MFMQKCFRWKILIAVRASRLNPHKTNKNIIIQLLCIITFSMADVIIKNLRQWVRFVMLIVFFKLGLISVGRGGPRRRNERLKALAAWSQIGLSRRRGCTLGLVGGNSSWDNVSGVRRELN